MCCGKGCAKRTIHKNHIRGMKMFAVRINPKYKNRPVTARGYIWVKSATHEHYEKIAERGIFETKAEAEHARTEKWEIIVEL